MAKSHAHGAAFRSLFAVIRLIRPSSSRGHLPAAFAHAHDGQRIGSKSADFSYRRRPTSQAVGGCAARGCFAASNSLRCWTRSEEHTSELQSRPHLVCRLLLEKKKIKRIMF